MVQSQSMKGVLICGGTGSRLRPLTHITHKSLLPVYDQPLIYYPLHTLLQAGITEIVVVTSPESAGPLMQYLGSGSNFSCSFTYRIQDTPGGIAQALLLAADATGTDNVCAILGDNVFLDDISAAVQEFTSGAHLFVKAVHDPERFGVVEMESGVVRSIEEKPTNPKSNLVQTGCYLYDAHYINAIATLTPSERNELEITDLNKYYLKNNQLSATVLSNEWIDAGTFDSLLEASNIIAKKRMVDRTVKKATEQLHSTKKQRNSVSVNV